MTIIGRDPPLHRKFFERIMSQRRLLSVKALVGEASHSELISDKPPFVK
jgi:hypothetical protein